MFRDGNLLTSLQGCPDHCGRLEQIWYYRVPRPKFRGEGEGGGGIPGLTQPYETLQHQPNWC